MTLPSCERCGATVGRRLIADLRRDRPIWEALCLTCVGYIPAEHRAVMLYFEHPVPTSYQTIMFILSWSMTYRHVDPGSAPEHLRACLPEALR